MGETNVAVLSPGWEGAAYAKQSSKAKDPLVRNIVVLGLIPRWPRAVTVQELREALRERGYDVSRRTLERDLAGKLSASFPLVCDGSPQRWSFLRDAHLTLPSVDPAMALAMHLAEGHLERLLPPGVLNALTPQFDEARRQLQQCVTNTGLSGWARSVRALPLGVAVRPAAVDCDIWSAVAEALLASRMLEIDYLSRSKARAIALRLQPLALVSRGAVSYLIGRASGYSDTRHFALNRIQSAVVSDEQSHDTDFNLDAYLSNAAFSPRHSEHPVRLRAHVHPDLAWSLREVPIASDQVLQSLADSNWELMEASLVDDEESIRWLRAQGPHIRVLAPLAWQNRIASESLAVARLYEMSATA